ncbi:hypothetical protein FRC12_024663 [Ceratobasidium sp. 428]|nr:hypothetical protein FRC12_024663 [Ceratobasidium sp. 428]
MSGAYTPSESKSASISASAPTLVRPTISDSDEESFIIPTASDGESRGHFPTDVISSPRAREASQYGVGHEAKAEASEIVSHLVDRGCKDVTSELDIDRCGDHPIAGGGFGDIYQGMLIGGMEVAIKCPRLFVKNDPQGNKMLKDIAREIYASSKLKHPNVLELIGLSTFRGHISIVTPWMENGTLFEYVTNNPEVDRFQLCIQAASGLAHLHEVDQVHGDVKSLNFLISENGIAKLTDFGNATLKQCTLKFTGTTSLSISARWTAPEILKGESAHTKEADVYALGMTFLETVTGKIPFSEIRVEHTMMWNVISGKTPERPEELDAMGEVRANTLWSEMSRCWSHKAPDRPSALEVKNRLEVLEPNWEHGGCPDVTYRLDLSRCDVYANTGGHFSDVYQGVLVGGEKVAIKRPQYRYLENHVQVKKVLKVDQRLLDKCHPRIAQEAYARSKLKHPNVLEVVGLATFRGQISIVSPWMENGTLPGYISKYPDVDRFELCTQVSAGLAYLHERETVHGDVKGENVLISELGTAKLAGFGDAVISPERTFGLASSANAMSVSRLWAAPERFSGNLERCTKETDIYALGMTFFETVAGTRPFPNEPNTAVLIGKTMGRPSGLNVMEKNRADVLWRTMSQCCSYRAARRPTAFEVEQNLEKATQQPFVPDAAVSTVVLTAAPRWLSGIFELFTPLKGGHAA